MVNCFAHVDLVLGLLVLEHFSWHGGFSFSLLSSFWGAVEVLYVDEEDPPP